MPSIGSSLGLTLPEAGDTSWDGPLNEILADLITAIEGTVSSGALLVNTNIDLSSYALRNVNYASFVTQASTLSTVNSVYFYGGNFYISNGSGTAVQITSGGSVVAAAGNLGNSGGTYGTSGIQLDWNGTSYDFKNGAGADAFAPIQVDEIRLRDGSSNYIALESATGLSSNVTLTFPALPASTSIVQVSNAGAISYSNTVANAATFSSTVSAGETSVTKLNYSTSRTFYTSPLDYTRHSSFSQDWTSSTGGGYIISSGAGTTNGVTFFLSNYGGTVTDVTCAFRTASAASGSHSTTITVYGPGTSTTLGTSGAFTTEDDSNDFTVTVSGLSYAGAVIVGISSVITSGISLYLKTIAVKVKWA